MNNNLFKIDDSEKMRILEMHQSATSRHYLGEQVAPATTTTSASTTPVATNVSKIGGITIPGFLFVEDDSEWLLKNSKANQQQMDQENSSRVRLYYGAGPTSADPEMVLNKYMIAFNFPSKSVDNYLYSKANVYPQTFLITKIYQNKAGFTNIVPNEGNVGFHVRVPKEGSSTKGHFLLMNGNGSLGKGTNGVFDRVGITLKSKPYDELDPKWKYGE
jgi:hypothetical protein